MHFMIDSVTGGRVPLETDKYMSVSHSWRQGWFDDDKAKHTAMLMQDVCGKHNVKYYWCDKLCVDQDDYNNKNVQIATMDKVYLGCSKMLLLVCWGTFIALRNVMNGSLDDMGVVIADSVFQSLWTLQEWILARCILVVSSSPENVSHTISFDAESRKLIGSNMGEWEGSRLENLVKLRRYRRDVWKHKDVLLYELKSRHCMIYHDRVYAIRSILPDHLKSQIEVNYFYERRELDTQWLWICMSIGYPNVLMEKFVDNNRILPEYIMKTDDRALYTDCTLPDTLDHIVVKARSFYISVGVKLVSNMYEKHESYLRGISFHRDIKGMNCCCVLSVHEGRESNSLDWLRGPLMVGKCVLGTQFRKLGRYLISQRLQVDADSFYDNRFDESLRAIPILYTKDDVVKGVIIRSVSSNNNRIDRQIYGIFELPKGHVRTIESVTKSLVVIPSS